MRKKVFKYIKFLVSMVLILGLIAPSYASLSASDGSAFVTKAEFDSALADLNSRLATFEAGINSKIDSQVTSYLDRNGIWNGKEQADAFSYIKPSVFAFFVDKIPNWKSREKTTYALTAGSRSSTVTFTSGKSRYYICSDDFIASDGPLKDFKNKKMYIFEGLLIPEITKSGMLFGSAVISRPNLDRETGRPVFHCTNTNGWQHLSMYGVNSLIGFELWNDGICYWSISYEDIMGYDGFSATDSWKKYGASGYVELMSPVLFFVKKYDRIELKYYFMMSGNQWCVDLATVDAEPSDALAQTQWDNFGFDISFDKFYVY